MGNQRLLKSLAEELKLPLLQIARQAELATGLESTGQPLAAIEILANQALWFVDSYLLSQQLLEQPTLELEPVAVSAVLQSAAENLDSLAKQYNCSVELDIGGRFAPVMAHRQGLQTALVSLGVSLITAGEPSGEATPAPRLVLAAHRSHGGVVAGVFSQADGLSQTVFQRGRELYGRSRQPLHEVSSRAASGVYVADSLFDSMQARLRVARHHQLTGLAATLQPSRQLSLV